MTKNQFSILSLSSFLLCAVLWFSFGVARQNGQLNRQLALDQQALNRARQFEPILDQIAKRVAKASDADPLFRDLLVKHSLNVTLETDGQKKNYP